MNIVGDINNNPNNPIINDRSFGDDPKAVARKGILLAQGLRDAGIIACAKHFPGHGDTNIDSHNALPTINHSLTMIMDHDLHPFKQLIADHIPAIMVAHIAVPTLDPSLTPASCSHSIVTDLLRKKLGFQGLIVTDGLGMGALTAQYKQPGDVEYAALMAGNDLLLCPIDIPAACTRIKQALNDGILTMDELDTHVARILALKKQAQAPIAHKDSDKSIAIQAHRLKQTLYNHAVTIVKNNAHVLPLAPEKKVVIISITHHKTCSNFTQSLCAQRICSTFILNPQKNTAHLDDEIAQIKNSLDHDTTIIITLDSMERSCKTQYGITPSMIHCIKQIIRLGNQTVLILFGNPYALSGLPTSIMGTIIVAYDHELESQQATADIVTGIIPAQGVLPVQITVNN